MPSQNYLLENIILETGFLHNNDGAVIGTTTASALMLLILLKLLHVLRQE